MALSNPTTGELQVGTILQDTYEVIQLIGRGGMGSVWKVTHKRLPGKRFAVKVLLGDSASNPEIYARFQREAEIASRLGHPNIVEVIDFNTLPTGVPYIVMEYLEGESLAARLHHRGALPLEETFGLVRQIASALMAAHRANVVHRDLKPDNIFLTPTDYDGVTSDRVKVLDFGISKIKDSTTLKTQTSALLGTPQYMSPEQASGKNKEIDARTDQFALGAIVYEMLTGRRAFGGETLAEIVCKVMLEQPEPIAKIAPQLPARVSAAVERALSKNLADRFPDLATFVAELSGRAMSSGDRPAVPMSHTDALAATMAAPTGTPQPAPQFAGAVQAAPTPPRSTAPPLTQAAPSRAGLVAIGVFIPLVLFGVGGFIWWQRTPAPTARPPSEPTARIPVDPPAQPRSPSAEPTSVVAAPASVVPAPTSPVAAPVSPIATGPKHGSHGKHGGAPAAIDAELEEKLQRAETALKARDFNNALSFANVAGHHPRAVIVRATVYCATGNLGGVNAERAKLPPAARKRLKRLCAQHDIDL